MFKFININNGWFNFSYFDGEKTFNISASGAVGDEPLICLLESTLEINKDNNSKLTFDEEGDIFIFKFVANDGLITITLFYDSELSKPISTRTIEIQELNNNILDFYNDILNNYSNKVLSKNWGEFPSLNFKKLTAKSKDWLTNV